MKMRATLPVLYAAVLFGAATLAVAQAPTGQKPKPPVQSVQAVPSQPEEDNSKNDPHVTGPFNPKDPYYKRLFFETNVGSFKLLGADPVKAQGTVEFSFKGTVLISDLEPGGKVTLSGAVAQEFQNGDGTKKVYFGNGKMTVVGRFRALQFFGQNLRGVFYGLGIFRFYGEFDKNLKTGTYQYEGLPQKLAWATGGGGPVEVPAPDQKKKDIKIKKD